MAIFSEAVTTVRWLEGGMHSAKVCTVEPEAMMMESFSCIRFQAAKAIRFFSSFLILSLTFNAKSGGRGLMELALPCVR